MTPQTLRERFEAEYRNVFGEGVQIDRNSGGAYYGHLAQAWVWFQKGHAAAQGPFEHGEVVVMKKKDTEDFPVVFETTMSGYPDVAICRIEGSKAVCMCHISELSKIEGQVG